MEDGIYYRYVNGKSPLYLSVVNSGNFLEFLYTMSANAKMLWDYDTYSTDAWNRDYAAQYFGQEYADKTAKLYKDYFYSFWTDQSENTVNNLWDSLTEQELKE